MFQFFSRRKPRLFKDHAYIFFHWNARNLEQCEPFLNGRISPTFLQGKKRGKDTNPHGEITGHLFLCTYSPFFFGLQRNWPQFYFTPQKAKGQPRHRLGVVPTGATWRHCTEEFLAYLHKQSSVVGLASCRIWLPSPEQTRAPLSFLPLLLPGSVQNQEQGENALETKMKKYRGQ